MIKDQLVKTISEYGMFSPGDKVVLGVSGGSDSICLLQLLFQLKKYRLELVVAHINHGLRGKESDRDEIFVKKAALALGLEFVCESYDTLGYKKQESLSTEDAARRLRYDFFQNTLKNTNADKIATAHNIDDQAETVLMRMIRGSGSSGLSGIPPVNGNIVRPLINISGHEIKNYLKSNSIKWREDSSNKSKLYLRNKIRHELIPQLRTYNPNIVETLSRTSDLMRLESEFLNFNSEAVFKSVFKKKHFGYIASIRNYKKLHKAVRLNLLRMCIENIKGDLKSVSLLQVLSIDNEISSDKSSSSVTLPGELMFFRGYRVFCISRTDAINTEFNYEINEPGEFRYENGFKVIVEKTSDRSMWSDENVGHFSLKKITFPLRIRTIRAGDRFKPLGSKGYKKVKDYFIDEKVPRFLRKSVPIAECTGGIFWVGGFRIDDRFKVGKSEKEFLRIRLTKPEIKLIKDF